MIYPEVKELPSFYADRLGIYYSKQVSIQHKKISGQFFTPIPIAQLMASFCSLSLDNYRILDPGCGTAILSCALIEYLGKTNSNIKDITLIAYETDPELMPFTRQVLEYLKTWLIEKKISFEYFIKDHDFVLDNYKSLNTSYKGQNNYDIIISNPPYFKLSKNDDRVLAASSLVSGQPNIYSLFMGIASKLLNKNGELICITPRSFASGNYFKAFRKIFFSSVQLDKIHLFSSRKDTFNRDSVLQETVIVKSINEKYQPNKQIAISSSSGVKDIFSPNVKCFSSSELIDINSKELIFHLPTNNTEESILKLISSWKYNLKDYNISISTGPVVSFRALDYILEDYDNCPSSTAPLFWLHNVNKMYLNWPLKLKTKAQYIKVSKDSLSLLIPNKNYILLRRFSTKDDKSRLIAAPYFCNSLKSKYIGVENKVNYIYRKDGHMDRSEVAGLCALLNSKLLDTYFQIFNGNVNVSATELRCMMFPDLNDVKVIGNKIILSNDYSMENVNKIVNEYFNLEIY